MERPIKKLQAYLYTTNMCHSDEQIKLFWQKLTLTSFQAFF